jgi:hypothetical protein
MGRVAVSVHQVVRDRPAKAKLEKTFPEAPGTKFPPNDEPWTMKR